ncbi:MAG: plastocyanin [Microgenomates group bacterium Gr01-1014_5]|nr:MAG: plastocyanin [Microgenomates group bacterium Gr01-1014_5]
MKLSKLQGVLLAFIGLLFRRTMNKGIIIGSGILVPIAVIVYLAVGQTSNKSTGVFQEQQTQAPAATESAPLVTPGQTETATIISVSGSEYNFTPKSINLEAGKSVKVVYKNTGTLPHDLVISELGVRTKVIGGGKEDTITFTPDKSGIYTFFCSVGNHRQLGMEGAVTVK